MKLFNFRFNDWNYSLIVNTRVSRRKFWKLETHKNWRTGAVGYYWWRFSFTYDQWHLEEIEVCNGCGEQVSFAGEDYISVCEGCGICEGDTHSVSAEKYENRSY